MARSTARAQPVDEEADGDGRSTSCSTARPASSVSRAPVTRRRCCCAPEAASTSWRAGARCRSAPLTRRVLPRGDRHARRRAHAAALHGWTGRAPRRAARAQASSELAEAAAAGRGRARRAVRLRLLGAVLGRAACRATTWRCSPCARGRSAARAAAAVAARRARSLAGLRRRLARFLARGGGERRGGLRDHADRLRGAPATRSSTPTDRATRPSRWKPRCADGELVGDRARPAARGATVAATTAAAGSRSSRA